MNADAYLWFVVVVVSCVALFGVFVGVLIGVRSERSAWLIRANSWCRTAHHCNGKFYYIIPESEFVRDYVRRTNDDPETTQSDA